jgi:hypothetical protein
MGRVAERESLATRLTEAANAQQPAAAVTAVRDYVAILRTIGKGYPAANSLNFHVRAGWPAIGFGFPAR